MAYFRCGISNIQQFEGVATSVAGLPSPIASFRTNASGLVLPTLKTTIEAVQSGSGDTSPSNPRPISGWTEANLSRVGKNLADGTAFAQALVANGASIDTVNKTVTYSGSQARNTGKVFDKFKPNTVYTFMAKVTSNSSVANINASIVYTDGTATSLADMTKGEQWAWTSNPNKSVDYFQFTWITGSPTVYYENFGIFEGTLTASDFVPYNGTTVTLQFGTTIYGGSIDWVSGVVTNTHKMLRITSVDTVHGDGKGARFSISPTASGYTLDTNHFYCNMLKPSNYSTAYDNHIHFANATIVALYFSEVIGTTTSEWATYLENNELWLCYELATPTTIQLTPQQIEQLRGENNVFVDCGEVEELEYIQIQQIGG